MQKHLQSSKKMIDLRDEKNSNLYYENRFKFHICGAEAFSDAEEQGALSEPSVKHIDA